jgi:metallo-beta-lactamase family protein
MCTAGRIKHHLKHNLWRPGSSLVIVGFQAEGTLGREIVVGARKVKIYGEQVAVQAKVFTIGGFSAHADQADLLEWISHFENPHMRIVVIHGERSVSEMFARIVQERFGLETIVPGLGDVVSLAPPELEMTAEEKLAPPEWLEHAARLARSLDGIRTSWEKNPTAFSPELQKRLAAQLINLETHLEEVSEGTGGWLKKRQ